MVQSVHTLMNLSMQWNIAILKMLQSIVERR